MSEWVEGLSFAQRQRLQFIEATLLWEGSVRRRDVCEVFQVTPNHLTRDIKRYRNHNHEALEYDVETRAYRRGKRFRPVFASGSPEEYLALLQAYTVSRSTTVIPALGHVVTAEVLPQPAGHIDPAVLKEVIRAMRDGTGIAVTYQSLSEGSPSKRTLWPHTLVYTGDRWHARAYDDKREDFRDFVLARITRTEQTSTVAPRSIREDHLWQESVTVEIVPASGLSPSQREVVAREYGMKHVKGGYAWKTELRKCLVPYFLHRYRLDARESTRRGVAHKVTQRIMLRDATLADRYTFKDV
ncbi:MAG: WYL domain-containing protein [Gammaproteobacteria bacterium]|nr:WYL domain-containing protein [Gammaproteobacteria bacterium]